MSFIMKNNTFAVIINILNLNHIYEKNYYWTTRSYLNYRVVQLM